MTTVGRPTIYNEQILIDTQAYIDSCGDYYEIREKPVFDKYNNDEVLLDENGEPKTRKSAKKRIKLPTIEGLAVHLNINPDTIYAWRKDDDKKEFSEIIRILLAKQAEMLINNGLSGDYNSLISKVLLSKHGYSERIEQTGKDGEPLLGLKDEDKARIDGALALLKKPEAVIETPITQDENNNQNNESTNTSTSE